MASSGATRPPCQEQTRGGTVVRSVGGDGGTRTLTVGVLSALPLPVGLRPRGRTATTFGDQSITSDAPLAAHLSIESTCSAAIQLTVVANVTKVKTCCSRDGTRHAQSGPPLPSLPWRLHSSWSPRQPERRLVPSTVPTHRSILSRPVPRRSPSRSRPTRTRCRSRPSNMTSRRSSCRRTRRSSPRPRSS